MARQYEQLKKMMEKAERLKEKAGQTGNPGMAEKYLRRVDIILASVQAITHNWKRFGERARGNSNFKGMRHSREARQKMSSSRKDFWMSKAGFDKMWRARRARQFREKQKCLLRFPRLSSSVDKKWLRSYRKKYGKIAGAHPDIRLY